jgi:hypothetical protein
MFAYQTFGQTQFTDSCHKKTTLKLKTTSSVVAKNKKKTETVDKIEYVKSGQYKMVLVFTVDHRQRY